VSSIAGPPGADERTSPRGEGGDLDWAVWAREIAARTDSKNRSVAAREALANALEAVENDPVRLRDESDWATQSRWLYKAMMLAPDLETFEALIRGEDVPRSRLDPEQAKRFGV
jgi:hypothetical protein